MTILFQDDFNISGADVNRAIWETPTGDAGYIAPTAFRNPQSWPDGSGKTAVSDGVAHLLLSTFNPTAKALGDSFWGSEIDTTAKFALGGGVNGLSFEARVRSPANAPPGMLTSLFGFNLTGGNLHDEIDWEFPTNFSQPGANPVKALLNRYVNEPTNSAGHPLTVDMSGINLSEFHTFAIQYFSSRIEWLVDGTVFAVETTNVPTGPLSMRLNIWAPSADFAAAYGPTLHPAANQAANVNYDYQVDWAKVESTATTFSDTVQSRVSYTLPEGVKNLTLTGNANLTGTGNQSSNVITGNAGVNVLSGGAGNDTLNGGAGSDTIDGGPGIDTAVFGGARATFALSKTSGGFNVGSAAEGSDTLTNVERLQFPDRKVALDLNGAAGAAAKILGAIFGKESVANLAYVGIGLNFLDGGTGYQDLVQVALNARLGAPFANADEVKLLFQNLIGAEPSTAELNFWVGTLTSGQYTQASLGVLAADSSINAVNINLVGLSQSGIEFV